MTHDDASATRSSRPLTYRVEVLGNLPDGLTAELANFTIEIGPHTTLSGPIADPAALYGLIARLESLGVTLLSVHRHNAGSDPNGLLESHAGTAPARSDAGPSTASSSVAEFVHPRNKEHDHD